ncbi:metal ABC transporter permease [Sinomonas susongensis]|uniref:metal ABC transporter permease n=1 Tax=Sinomonas susongensis TaxID=1324851 RepID=UPI0011094039|nr:metal ABC transporter permease [Sinomonas susongensis]
MSPTSLLEDLFAYPFMVNAFQAGTIVAVAAGAIGWFMVQRRQSFAGHTLAVIGFPGAAAATWLGSNPAVGYFVACIGGALIIAALPHAGHIGGETGGVGEESAVIGTVQAFALAAGFLFVSLYQGFLSGLNNLLFGTITGVTTSQVQMLAVAGIASLTLLAVIARPLLFATIDPAVAASRGIPVRAVSGAFLVLLGVAAAGTSQVTGSLLVFALLVAPAATAVRLTARPDLGIALSVAIALMVTWAGEAIAYFSPYPIGFWVTSIAFAAFLAASAVSALRERRGRRRQRRTKEAVA